VTLTASAEVSAVAEEFDSVLDRLTKNAAEPVVDDVWAAVVAGGWLDVGDRNGAEPYRLTDLVEFAISWGRHAMPLPYTTTLLARRWITHSQPDDVRLTFAYGRAGETGAVPFAGRATCLVPGGTVWDGEVATVDLFAPTLPIGAAAGVANQPAELAHEATVLFAAEALGGARTALDRAIEYAGIRKAYGQEIGRFQAVQHILADAYVSFEVGRAGLVRAIAEPASAVRTALLVARGSQQIVESAIQVFGGIGFTWELGVHQHYRHALAVQKLLSYG
jgi:hypothetical protein